ncbi:histone H3.v1-like [Cebidichthys violaceus]|uniref:histone H3.v1-like n=1 Tax=Cebidichthys violaceus TaxID=271503 RepID=UPI0035CA474D
MGEQRPCLEPIQEESEREDESKGSKTGEEEEEEDEETMEVMAEDESEDDEDAPLRVVRPGRMSRSLSQKSFLRIQSVDNNGEETESDQNTHTVSKWKKNTTAELPVQKKRNSKVKKKKESLAEELFPRWLVNLMVNIEEATTHQLVVE